MPVGKAGHPEEHFPFEDLVKTEFYNDWLRPIGDYGTASGIVLHRDPSRLLILSGNVRLKEAEAIRVPLARLLDLLAPHISRAFELMRHLPGDQLAQDYRTTSELASEPVFFVDKRGCAIYSNSNAQALRLGNRVMNFQKNGQLIFLDGTAHTAFESALKSVVEQKYRQLKGDFDVRATDGTIYKATLAPLRPRASGEPAVFDQIFDDLPVALLLMRPPKTQNENSVIALKFGLTSTELALAHTIARGISPREAAELRGVSINTVRTQLKSIYSKTGLHRQTQLAAIFRR